MEYWKNFVFACFNVLVYNVMSCRACISQGILNNGTLLRGSSYRFYGRSDVFSCASFCISHILCASFHVHKPSRMCFLNYKNSSDVMNFLNDDDFVQSDINSWSTSVAGPCAGHTCPPPMSCVVLRRGGTTCRPVPFMAVGSDDRTTYELIFNRQTWSDARDTCETLGGHLAIVENSDENDFINNILIAIGSLSDFYSLIPVSLFWFGATDSVSEGTWKWVDGASVVYSWWQAGQPNNVVEQDCGATVAERGWKSFACHEEMRSVCEFKL